MPNMHPGVSKAWALRGAKLISGKTQNIKEARKMRAAYAS
jgi:hypothetical protein